MTSGYVVEQFTISLTILVEYFSTTQSELPHHSHHYEESKQLHVSTTISGKLQLTTLDKFQKVFKIKKCDCKQDFKSF